MRHGARRMLSIKQFGNGTFVIGGGYRGVPELRTGQSRVSHGTLGYNLWLAAETVPGLGKAQVVRCWSGIEGRSVDMLPVIGPSEAADGLWHAFGFSTHGFYSGPAVGKLLVQAIIDGQSDIPLDSFSVSRPALRTPGAPSIADNQNE